MKTLQKGFTLIELLVVIAIIGILSSIVLASLSSARNSGTNAAIQSSLGSMKAQAELYASRNSGTYASASTFLATGCLAHANSLFSASSTNGGLYSLLLDVQTKAGGTANVSCAVSTSSWAVAARFVGGTGAACVDSTGVTVSSSTRSSNYAFTAATSTCPTN